MEITLGDALGLVPGRHIRVIRPDPDETEQQRTARILGYTVDALTPLLLAVDWHKDARLLAITARDANRARFWTEVRRLAYYASGFARVESPIMLPARRSAYRALADAAHSWALNIADAEAAATV